MTDARLSPVLDKIDADLPDALDRLMTLLRIQSISTDPAYKESCDSAADWLVSDLESIGFDASKRPTPGHPMVVGHGGEGDGPHVTFYGHYDVQPVDPVDLWNTPPFEPVLEDTAEHGQVIRGRGASDDKGQLMTFVEACRAWKAVHGSLPTKISFFFEGEEESGSPSLIPFMEENAEELKSDLVLICDTGMVAPGVPSIASQLRGMLKDEFTITGPRIDLHSGHYGGPGLNPLREIARIIASFHDDTGRVAVDGFYEGVHEVSAEQKAQWEGCGFDEKAYLEGVGYTQPHGEAGYTTLEQQWARPTLEVNGLWGGYMGAGTKTVIPSKAHCKITCRLVGDMDPDKLREKIRKHVEDRLSPDATVTWDQDLDGSPAAVMNTSRPEFEAARKALTDEWDREAVFVGMGGSIPIAGFFKEILGMDAMLIGFANEDDQIHSPNEKYNVESFHKGIRSWARVLAELSD
ncbi:acetylornithine deacetylase/succinyl-diaminopimelate desuccinylase-like protein [Aliiruegeria haliotis]|uniref:Acetylornithine deacetylase/succinyl-diaminopimelate desuccinylase-like protein n=1 Tax=Aliiruegeria haliotis TaxID=1280846 RepID=A0A2T0RZ98_9RHOB|nr:dipeptidase [Aliiruegeria haliotis]PRY26509.1 acetylornithine deacetylase/succinyl-diaminopimelate desuccinylase-like protein [Aliiruegeria haliotis]